MKNSLTTLIILSLAISGHAQEKTPIVTKGDPAIVTHKFQIRGITFGFSDQGGGYLNHMDLGNGRNIVPAFFGRGWQGSVRDQFHSGRYNPTQAGFRDHAGTPVKVIVSEHGLEIPKYQLPLYGDPVFDFTEHEDLADDFRGYKDNNNSDTDGIDEAALTQDAELHSEFDFEGTYEDASDLTAGKLRALRFYSRYTYARKPQAMLQFGKAARLADGNPVLIETARTKDISRRLAGDQTAKDEDLSNIIFTTYGIRLVPESGFTTPLWLKDGKWQTTALKDMNGLDKEKRLFLPTSSPVAQETTKDLDLPFVVLAKGSDPDTSQAVGLYSPLNSDINAMQVQGLDATTGKGTYREDRRTHNFLVLSHIDSQEAILHRTILTGLLAPGNGRENTHEALRNETYILFGTPNQIAFVVAQMEKAKR